MGVISAIGVGTFTKDQYQRIRIACGDWPEGTREL
jgi:hypothetical protein